MKDMVLSAEPDTIVRGNTLRKSRRVVLPQSLVEGWPSRTPNVHGMPHLAVSRAADVAQCDAISFTLDLKGSAPYTRCCLGKSNGTFRSGNQQEVPQSAPAKNTLSRSSELIDS
jgi:hypothetical protein